MRQIVFFLLLFKLHSGQAQTIAPGEKSLLQLSINPATYTMKLFMVRDTTQRELGEALVTISNKEGKLFITQDIKIAGMTGRWTDSTITEEGTLKPLYHASYNLQRDIVIRYSGNYVTGYYYDKGTQITTPISDTIRAKYFDSNFYPFLITALPLKEGYTAKFAIYDYAGPQKHGQLGASVDSVKKTTIIIGSKRIAVFEVSVFDEISNGWTRHYVGVNDHAIYQVDSVTPRGTMRMVRVNK